MTAPAPTPVAPHERIEALDVARGFALLGVLVMNMEFFARPLQAMLLGFDTTLEGADRAVAWVLAAFMQGKFLALFSLLFGAGFALMLERAQTRNSRFGMLFLRRMLALLAIGAAHAILVWAGDILVPYALTGLAMLLFFRSTPAPHLWRWGIASYAVPLLLTWLIALVVVAASLEPTAHEQMQDELARSAQTTQSQIAVAAQAYEHGCWLDVTRQRLAYTQTQLGFLWLFAPTILGLFLFGAWLIRSGRLRDPAAHRAFFVRVAAISLPIGAVFALAAMPLLVGASPLYPDARLALGQTLMGGANLLLALGYLAAIVLLSLSWPALRRWLAPVGRVALTNYLLQSIVMTTLFYGYGAGLWGEVSRSGQLLLALAFFALQVIGSRAWMARFRYGPAEWLWRALTYGRAPPMRG